MSSIQRVLVLGTGPAAVQLVVTFKNHLGCYTGIAGRKSVRSELFFEALAHSNRRVRAAVQNRKHRQMQGACVLDRVFQGYETVEGEWDTLILAVTTDAYLAVLHDMPVERLRQVRRILLLSPTFGSNSLVRHYMREVQPDVEIVSYSSYFGDTRWADGKPSGEVITTALKNKVFIGSTHGRSPAIEALCGLYEKLGTTLQTMVSPLAAESRNISLYVHPPLFMNEFSLGAVFGETGTKKYVYKMFPEGPITHQLIRDMLAAWKEIMSVLEKLRIEPFNLLKFMMDDNYPVRPESLSRPDIERFPQLETIHQEYLLYIRYASLLIDPFSEPDAQGRYFDFSAVPIRQIYVDHEGRWEIPRMPKEDYYRIKVIRGIAGYLRVSCPTIDKFVETYERAIEAAARARQGERLSPAFAPRSFAEDVTMICMEMEKRNERVEELR